MSVVTNVILILDNESREILQLNCWLKENAQGTLALLPLGAEGGTKYMECDVYLGAFNHLDVPGFVEAFRSGKYDDPETVQLFVRKQEADRFTEYRPHGQ